MELRSIVVPDVSAVGYVIWGVDHAPYGPVELPVLVGWIKDERVLADTWLFMERNGCWEQAARVPELQMFFHQRRGAIAAHGPAGNSPMALSPGALRHVKVLGCLNDEQLDQFLQFAEIETVAAGTPLVRRGEPANAMFLIVEGQLRFSLAAEGREIGAGNLNAGEFFGEISLFDQGLRNADITAIEDSTLLKITTTRFERMSAEKPELVAPFLGALTKSVACHIRTESHRYRDSLCFVQPAGR